MSMFFEDPAGPGAPPADTRPRAALAGDGLAAAMRAAWDARAAVSARLEPTGDARITAAQVRHCGRAKDAAARLGWRTLPLWEVYLCECEGGLERTFDREVTSGRFAAWMERRKADLDRRPA